MAVKGLCGKDSRPNKRPGTDGVKPLSAAVGGQAKPTVIFEVHHLIVIVKKTFRFPVSETARRAIDVTA